MPAIEFMAKTPIMSAVGDAAASVGAAAMKAGQMVGTTQTKFSVDLDQAQKLIDGLTKAKDELMNLYNDAEDIVGVNSPGKDMYSGFATMAVRQAAGDDPGGYRWANAEARKALDDTILNIQRAIDSYKETEAGNTNSLKG